ncbi:MAG: tRNA-intron lyase [Candidatus Heimdallarchaeota archaeon]|nr:tRNA-intron lyase [Candidatus Heimdallarchaeota archaeon]
MGSEAAPILELIGKEIILWDEKLGSILYSRGFFGKPLGIRKSKPGVINRPLILSLFETLYLMEGLKIRIKQDQKELSVNEFQSYANDTYDGFERKYLIYSNLRDLGYVVKPGMKFGGDFVIYKKGPGLDHSQWVVQVENDQSKITAINIVRASRLASSVKKKYLISTINDNNDIQFYGFEREKI